MQRARVRRIVVVLLALLSLGATAGAAGATTADEARLYSRLPQGLRDLCALVPPEARTPTALAGLRCDLTDTDGFSVVYESFPDHAAVTARYRDLLVAGPGADLYRGRCPAELPSESAYIRGDAPYGRYACFVPPGTTQARIVWTYTLGRVVAVAERPDGDMARLATFWSGAGPFGPAAPGPVTLGGLYPDPAEMALLLQLPRGLPKNCARSRQPRSRTLIVARLTCLADRGRIAVFYHRFATQAQTRAAYLNVLRRRARTTLGNGDCPGTLPGEEPWSTRSGRGRLVCWVGDRPWLAWSNEGARVLGQAVTRELRMSVLHRWWFNAGL